ncbi:hypothetical protein RN001_006484 [Aquatica leii]|uniref:G-protein coupled receptors family 2 profile 2 domain-containing protein n=1 Tax=Aquatica leii TaxID=1421715 RepID=A0AAN7P834_9COLE|nr:hypothetical protein RN001_006484 [Aquatica leii]
MWYKNNVMKNAQLQLNSTDIALNAFDVILTNSKVTYKDNLQTVFTKNVIVQISHLSKSIISGSVLYNVSNKSTGSFEGYGVKPLYISKLDSLLQEDFEIAAIASSELMNKAKSQTNNDHEGNDFIVSFFYNDMLFNYKNKVNKTFHMVASVLIPKIKNTSSSPIYIITKLYFEYKTYNCVHWKYGLNEMDDHIQGRWVINGQAEIRYGRNRYAICTFNHTTHFALLVSSANMNQLTEKVNLALNIITIIGCALSLVGLTGIFVIAIFFKHWRKRTRNKIMLNFSAALTAQTILLFISDTIDQNTTECIAVGASLHYTVLSGFAWMVIVAILQYRKFVLVFQHPVPHFLIKCVLVGWCLPALPVLIILIVAPESYNKNTSGICYPDGTLFYYGVVLPISIFALINLFVFVKILINIFNNKVEKYGSHSHEIRLHVSIAILLFFLLGMSWIFGIGISFTKDTSCAILSFIFCFTATLQGFVMFIFFILINRESRALCLNIKRVIMCAQNKSNT